MTEEIRKPGPADRAAIRRLWESCFLEEQPAAYADWYFDRVYRDDISLCLFSGGVPACSLQMVPYALKLRGRRTAVDTLSSVVTGEAYRRQGMARRLMAAALGHMAARGVGFTFLYPFDHGFYERLGWATCSAAQEYRLPAEDLPDEAPDGYSARIEGKPDIQTVSAVYSRWSAGYHCASIRSETDWQKRIGENIACGGFTAIATYRGEPCAYAICEIEKDEINAYELAAVRTGAVQAMLAALKPRGLPVRWTAPEGDRAHLLPGRWMNAARLRPHVMFRVTDVELAFRQATPSASSRVILDVTGDGMRPENNGVYTVTASKGEARAEKTDEKPQFSCGIGALARIMTGYMDAREAAEAGLAEGEDQAVGTLQAMYPAKRNFLFELY